jgi:hypothetical protein
VNELHSDALWKTIRRLARKSSVKRAAVAYVTSDDMVRFGDGDILVTDASDAAIAGGQTDAEVLVRAFDRGVRLYHLDGLHAKVMLLDGVAVIGSANLSASSASSLVEAAWVTDHPTAVGMVGSLIEQLAEQASPIDGAFLARAKKIPVSARRGKGAARKPGTKVNLPPHQSWIIGVHELARDFPAEAEDIARGEAVAEGHRTRSDSEVEWIRWTGNSRFRTEARRGDTVIQIWRPRGATTPMAVYRHASILHRQEEPSCTRFYVEAFGDAEEATLTWARFRRLLKQVRVPAKIGPNSARRVAEEHADALFSLWGK